MKKADMILIGCLMLLSVVLLVPLINGVPQARVAVVQVKGEEVMRIDLGQDDTYSVEGANGEVAIEVKDGAIRVEKENSPHHICSRQGFVSSSTVPIVCLPNETVITIENGDDGEDTALS